MKKLFAMILTLCLLCGATALAVEGEYSGTTSISNPTTEIKTTVGEEFTIVIPPEVIVPFNQLSTDLPVEVTKLRTKAADAGMVRMLYVQVSNNSGKMICGADELRYTLDPGEQQGSMKALFFDKTGAKNMKINIAQADWDQAPAGTYTNTVTFTAAIANFTATN